MSSQLYNVAFITNGRSTWRYALGSIERQTVPVCISFYKDIPWVEANNRALSDCKGEIFFRVDDDMFLHPRAFEFMLSSYNGAISHTAKLYEHFSRRVAGKIRLYNKQKTVAIGGFRPNKLGKIDRTFEGDCERLKHGITTADKHSPVGLHACASWKEQVSYEGLWGYKKSNRDFMRGYKKSVEWQALNAVRLIERYNSKNKTAFWNFLNDEKP